MGNAACVVNSDKISQIPMNVDALMRKDGAKAAYQKFIENGSWKSSIEEIQKSLQLEGTVDPAATQEALHRYMNTDEDKDIDISKQGIDIYTPKGNDDGISLTPDAIKKLSLAAVHPLFLASQEYQEWIDSMLITKEEITSEPPKETREARLDILFQPSEHLLLDVMETSLASFDQKELDELISDSGDSWVVDVLLAVENLPFCVSIATARESRNFPLVYVNKAFEKATGYSRNEIVGHNCKFLQGNDFEPEKVKIISDKLRCV